MSDRRFYGILVVVVAVTALVMGAALWVATGWLSEGVLRALTALGVLALPAVFWSGWRLGSRDARAFVSGLERGTGEVIRAGGEVADLRKVKVAAFRQAFDGGRAGLESVPLPQVEIVSVGGGGGEVEL